MRAIFLDAVNGKITEIDIAGDLASIQKLVNGYIEVCAFTTSEGDHIYVDEEGMLKKLPYGFAYAGAPQALYFGNGVMLGGPDDEGDEMDAQTSLMEVLAHVRFWRNVPRDYGGDVAP